MPDAPDSTNKVIPPFSPLKAQIEPPDKKRRRGPKMRKMMIEARRLMC